MLTDSQSMGVKQSVVSSNGYCGKHGGLSVRNRGLRDISGVENMFCDIPSERGKAIHRRTP